MTHLVVGESAGSTRIHLVVGESSGVGSELVLRESADIGQSQLVHCSVLG